MLGTHAPQHSKLAFRRTCCWRAPSLKSSKTCQPEHQFFFRKTSPEGMFSARFHKNVYDKNILAWHRNFCVLRNASFFPGIPLASVSNQSQSVHGTPLNATTTLAKKFETGTQAKHRRVHARQITRLCHVLAVVSVFLARVVPNPFRCHWNSNVDLCLFPLFSVSTGAIALIKIPLERSFHGGAHRENRVAKACFVGMLKCFEWGQVLPELSGQKPVVLGAWKSYELLIFVLRKKGSKTKKRMKEEETTNRSFSSWFLRSLMPLKAHSRSRYARRSP